MEGSLGRTNFSSDPAYQAALQAAARSSVLAATSGLSGLSISSQPPPPPVPSTSGRGFSSDATPPPKPPPPPPPQRQRDAAAAAPGGVGEGPSGSGRRASGSGGGGSGGGGGRDAQSGQSAQVEAGGAHLLGKRNMQPRAAVEAVAAEAAGGAGKGATPGRSGSGRVGGGGGGGGGKDVAREAAPGRFAEYLPQEELQRGLKSGQLFRAKVRVNPNDRKEAYAAVPGFPHDLLLRGEGAQNRCIEGDEVAVALQPVTAWYTVNRIRDKAERAGLAAEGPVAALGASLAQQLSRDDAPWRSAADPAAVREMAAKIAAARPELRITAKVVGLLEPSPRREQLVGLLQFAEAAPLPHPHQHDGNNAASGSGAVLEGTVAPIQALPTCYLLPLDPRMPRCVVRPSDVRNLPPVLIAELRAGERAESRTLMSARIAEWSSSHAMPAVTLRASLGQAGEIEPETAALLEMEGIRTADFSPEVLACLPPTPWSIAPEELAKRRDFRSTRVFSIDPPTAKDLDDALSIEPLPGPEGGWRVGVHIADVAHFIPPFSALDVEAGQRATSTYLVQRMIPMLPALLCEELCSLNPGVERLAFSVVWDMGRDGSIRSTWFGRSVIRSCAKLSYPLVQQMIEGRFEPATCPVQLHGEGVSWEQVIGDSLALWGLAKQMRAARFAGGALRLDNIRLCYKLDKEGNPVSTAPYVIQEANQLVEEFMLLANMSVADAISQTFRDRALLRRHTPPLPHKLKVLEEVSEAAGLRIDTSSAGAIQDALNQIRAQLAEADAEARAVQAAAAASGADGDGAVAAAAAAIEQRRHKLELLVMMATRPMVLAEYFCTGLADDEETWRHYALAVRAYTHFTSPIRRYPDVVVHRLLAAALEVRAGAASPEEATAKHRLLDTRLAGLVADHCNGRRLAARNAQDGSLKLYLCVLLKRHPTVTTATISNVNGDRFVGAYLPEYGHEVRIEMSELGVPAAPYWDAGSKTLTVTRGEQRKQEGNKQRRGGGFGGKGSGGGGGGSGAGSENPDLASWVSSLPPVQNPRKLRPVGLPLHLAMFTDVPVVLTAVTPAGQPSQLVARLFLAEAAEAIAAKAAEAAGAKAAAAVEGPVVRESEIPMENLVMD